MSQNRGGATAVIQLRYKQLDGLRGVAAFVVLINHASAVRPGKPISFDLLFSGNLPVVVFFVLSGFVLSLPFIAGGPQSLLTFYVRRITRIYLPYTVCVILALALAASIGHREIATCSEWFNQHWQEPASAATAMHYGLMTGLHNDINPPTWSLVWEMRISLLFPFAMMLVAPWRWLGIGLLVMACAVWWATFWALHLPDPIGLQAKQLPIFASMFLVGCYLALVAKRAKGGAMVQVSLMVAGLALSQDFARLTWTENQFVKAVAAGLIVYAVLLNGPIRQMLEARVCRWLGRVSYSLYLVHVPIIVALVQITRGVHLVSVLAAACVLSLLTAEAFHYLVEAPSQSLGRRLRPGSPVSSGRNSEPITTILPAA